MFVGDLDDRAAGYIFVAIEKLRRELTYSALKPPPDVDSFACYLRSRVRRGQRESELVDLNEIADAEAVSPWVLDYEAAAAALRVSRSSLQRLVSSGELPTVSIGGAVRIRMADIDRYVADLQPIDRTAKASEAACQSESVERVTGSPCKW